MRLIAKKPCSFGGQQFYIGDEIPAGLVADAKLQEGYGVIAIMNDSEGESGAQSVSLFTQEQVEKMIAEAVEEAKKEKEDQLAEMQAYVAELKETELGLYDGAILISVKGESDEQQTAVPATPEEIQQVFSIMQMNADEGAKAVVNVMSESVLILLHAADGRKTIKDAAKKRADILFMLDEKAVVSEVSTNVNTTTISNGTIGVDVAANAEGAGV